METPPNKEVHIVAANLQNLKELIDISRRSFLEAYPQNTDHENMDLYLKEVFTEKEMETQLLNPNSRFFIMRNGKAIMAYAKLRWDRAPEHFEATKVIELERFYFLDKYKGKGYGSHFLEFCIDYSIKGAFEWMWLLVWEENRNGMQFYEHKGFKIFGRKTFHFGKESSEDVLMKLRL